ncbi:MAG: accessory gene regulator B family protein [Herbinix sp.]|nr:accessory gene regulator B family protein [Herbinix sp.]
MTNEQMIEFIKDHKNYNDLKAMKAAYQVRLFKRSLVYTVLLGIILGFMGLLKECLILFVFLKLFRTNSGGIHVTGQIKCFVFSFLILISAIGLSRFISLNIYIEAILYMFIAAVWYILIPQGTSQRPFRKAEEKRKMKYTMLVLIVITFALRFVNTEIYTLALWALVITFVLTTPPIYSLFRVKHDRIQNCTQ